MNRVVNRPIALVISQWLQGVVPFILDQRNSFSQSALSWHVPVKCKKLKDCEMSVPPFHHFTAYIPMQHMHMDKQVILSILVMLIPREAPR